jgi:transposase
VASRTVGAAIVLALAAGCRDTPPSHARLVDSSPARPPPVRLEGIDGPAVQTLVRLHQTDAIVPGSRASACIASFGGVADGLLIERIGVRGSSVTLFDPQRGTAYACDSRDGTSCGRAFARLREGRLPDPRLTLSCSAEDGDAIGFAWIEPTSSARYVVIEHSGYAEAYAVKGDVPVRVTTDASDLETSGASFAVSEHARDGRRLRAYEVEAQVAG